MSRFKNIPKVQHWAIITERSTTIPGDERSKTNPGHGYPEHTEYSTDYEVFATEKSWLAEINKIEKTTSIEKEYLAIKVFPVRVEKKINVEVNFN